MSGTVGRAVSLRASCHGSFSPPSRCSDSAAARVVPPDDLLLPGSSVHLVHTAQTIKQLEYLSAAVLSSRAILLEGETASRKTALVKELARLTNNRLVVIPMTQDTEVAQLIGQWLPRQRVTGQARHSSRVGEGVPVSRAGSVRCPLIRPLHFPPQPPCSASCSSSRPLPWRASALRPSSPS